MAAVAMREIDGGRKSADMRYAGQRQREVAAPREVDLDAGKLREGFHEVRLDIGDDILGVAPAVIDAAAIKQAVVGGATIIIEHVIGVLDAVICGKQAFQQPGVERFGGQNLARDRHHAARNLWQRLAEIGIAADQHIFRLYRALCRLHGGRSPGVDLQHPRVLENPPAQPLDHGGFAERVVQRVEVAA